MNSKIDTLSYKNVLIPPQKFINKTIFGRLFFFMRNSDFTSFPLALGLTCCSKIPRKNLTFLCDAERCFEDSFTVYLEKVMESRTQRGRLFSIQ